MVKCDVGFNSLLEIVLYKGLKTIPRYMRRIHKGEDSLPLLNSVGKKQPISQTLRSKGYFEVILSLLKCNYVLRSRLLFLNT